MFNEKINAERPELTAKKEKYEALCGGKPDSFAILGQGVEENPKSSRELKLKSSSYADVDYDGLMVAGKGRVIAGAELSHYFPDAKVVTNSKGKMRLEGTDQEVTVFHAEVMAQELKHLGVNPENIIIQKDSYSVFSELIELIKLIVKNKWKHMVILTNEYQLPRCRAMLDKIDSLKDPHGESEKAEFKTALAEFKEMKPTVQFVSAEDILPLRSDHYKKLIDEIKNSDAWKTRAAMEKAGAQQVIDGKYWKNITGFFVDPKKL